MLVELTEMRYDKIKKEFIEFPLFVNPVHVMTVGEDDSNFEPVRCRIRTAYRTVLVKGSAATIAALINNTPTVRS